ncbi:MAG: hypothetical protein JOZ78_11800 [Chroococcidiopsidaceae cyanobacterium CP_BM_ER_R8_30]|nr:hypothetical protein [Chroococcidiopsidaceae cyanobacterium CP_BM_ER_R8_30]
MRFFPRQQAQCLQLWGDHIPANGNRITNTASTRMPSFDQPQGFGGSSGDFS